MSVITHDIMVFDVERALARAYGCGVETVACQADRAAFNLNRRWRIELDAEQLSKLHDYASDPRTLRDHFDEHYKSACLTWLSYKA